MTSSDDLTSVVTARVVQALPLLYNLFVCASVPHVARQSWETLQGAQRGDVSASQWHDVTAGGKRLLIAFSASLWLGLAFIQLTALVQDGDPKHGWFAVFVEPIRRCLPFYVLFLLFCLTIRTAQGSLLVTVLRPEEVSPDVPTRELWQFWYAPTARGVSVDILGGAALTVVCVFVNSTSVIVLVGCSCAYVARRVLYAWHHSLGETSFRFQLQVYACIMLALTLAMLVMLALLFFFVWLLGLEGDGTNKDKDQSGDTTGSDLVVSQWYSITWIVASTVTMIFPASLVAMTYRFEMHQHRMSLEEDGEEQDTRPRCATFHLALAVLVAIQVLGLFANFFFSPTFNAPAFPKTALEKGSNSLLGFTFNVQAFLAYNVLLIVIPAHVGYTFKMTTAGRSFRQGVGALYAYKEVWSKVQSNPCSSTEDVHLHRLHDDDVPL